MRVLPFSEFVASSFTIERCLIFTPPQPSAGAIMSAAVIPCHLIGLEPFHVIIYCAPIEPNSIWKYSKVLPLVILII